MYRRPEDEVAARSLTGPTLGVGGNADAVLKLRAVKPEAAEEPQKPPFYSQSAKSDEVFKSAKTHFVGGCQDG